MNKFQRIAYEGQDTPRYENGGFYGMRCKANDYYYIGASKNPQQRFRDHKSSLERRQHHNYKLQNAYDQYGKDAFEYFILNDGYSSQFQLDLYEDHIIDWYRPNVFNIRRGGSRGSNADETRQKMSEANKGEKNGMYGRHHTEESKKKNSITQSRRNNKTGLYRVHKEQCPKCKKGFRWIYQYYKNNKCKTISSVDIDKLEQKVKAQGLSWKRISEL